jgi:uroporphyrinogen-III decarboxylase
MDLAEVKRKIGDRVVLWGGVPVELIIGGSMDEVRREVRTAMANAKAGGRFILGTTHTIAVGSNYDNFMAMVDEYRKHCDY